MAMLFSATRANAADSWVTAISAPIRGSGQGEMKVTDNDPLNEGTPDGSGGSYNSSGAVTCDPAFYGVSWPFSVIDLDAFYQTTTPLSGASPSAEPQFTAGVWGLDDVVSMVDALELTGQNLYLSDVRNGIRWIPPAGVEDAARNGCVWASFAAINDVIQYREDHVEGYAPIYTGVFLETTGEAYRWACHYRPFIGRARQEADDHSHVKIAYVDELWKAVDGPETHTWQPGAHWGVANVEALWKMAHGTYIGRDQDVFGQQAPSNECPASGAGIDGSTDVELWSRTFSPGIPRYVVPSAILGMPADPAGAGSTSTDYVFEAGDEGRVTFTVTAPNPGPVIWSQHPNWEAWVEFLYADGDNKGAPDQGLELHYEVNQMPLSWADISLYGRDTGEVHRAARCVGTSNSPSACATTWDAAPWAQNQIDVWLDTAHAATDLDVDRTAYVFGVRVKYVDTSTGQTFWQSMFQDPVSAGFSTSGSPGSMFYATSNVAAGFLLTDWLDGVAVTQQHQSLQFDPVAFDQLMDLTCGFLDGPEVHKGCLVDEAGAVFGDGTNGDTIYEDLFPPDEALARMEAADAHGQGVLSTHLPLSVLNAGMDRGRFTPRTSLLSGYETMTYEGRLTRTLIGEHHQWTYTVPAGCGGTYDVYWKVTIDETGSVEIL